MADEKFDPTQCKWHTTQIEEMRRALYGNGEGLVKDMTSVKTLVKVILALLIPTFVGMVTMLLNILSR